MKAVYIRISKASQSSERQLKDDESILPFIDICSGSIPFAQRQEGIKLMNNNSITQIEVKEVSRLGRNLKDILTTLEYFTEKKVDIYIQNQGLHTLVNGKINPTAQMIIAILGTIAQQERDLLIERTNEGVAIAKAKGKYKGRKRGAEASIEKYNTKYFTIINKAQEMALKGHSINSISNILECNRITLTKLFDLGLIKKKNLTL
jgi:DNA invertase Pin-like site-specific DNA recombinase